jgi:hypothetical protein
MENNQNRMKAMRNQIRRFALAAFAALILLVNTPAQQVVDKTIAVVRDATRSELITYSDLIWYLALQPGIPIDPPRSEDLNIALQGVINERLFALEAKRLPTAAPTSKEFADYLNEDVISRFHSPAEFEARLRQVGFTSIKDESFEKLLAERLAIKKYIDFRFGSFVVVTPDEVLQNYRGDWSTNFRRRSPGLLLPSFEEVRGQIEAQLREDKKLSKQEAFLDEAKTRDEIEILAKPEPLPRS